MERLGYFDVFRRVALFLILAGGLLWALPSQDIYRFSVVSAVVASLVAFPFEWKRTNLERILLFRKEYHGFIGIGMRIYSAFRAIFSSAVIAVLALFTFPSVKHMREFKHPSIQLLADQMGSDFIWSLTLILSIIVLTGLVLLVFEYFGHAKGARISYFRLALVVGFAYASMATFVKDTSAVVSGQAGTDNIANGSIRFDQGPVFASPGSESVMIAGVALARSVPFLRKAIDSIQAAKTEAESNSARIAHLERVLAQVSAYRVPESDRVKACEELSQRYEVPDCKNKNVKRNPECRRPFGGNPKKTDGSRLIRLLPGVKTWDSAQPILWSLYHCGVLKDAKGNETGLVHWCEGDKTKAGCFDSEGQLQRELDALRKSQALLIGLVTDIPTTPNVTTQSALPLLAIADDFVIGQIRNAVDNLGVLAVRRVYDLSDLLSNESYDRTSLKSNSRGGRFTPGICDVTRKADWDLATRKWCGNPVHKLVEVIVSPFFAQGAVIAIYLASLLMIFGRPAAAGNVFEKMSPSVWNYSAEALAAPSDETKNIS